MICAECEKDNALAQEMAKLQPQFMLCRLPGKGFCVVDALALSTIPGEGGGHALVMQMVKGSEDASPLGAVLKAVEILNEKAKNKT